MDNLKNKSHRLAAGKHFDLNGQDYNPLQTH